MKENKNTTCDPCERDFEKKIHELEREGEAPSAEERAACEEEVKAAFGERNGARGDDRSNDGGGAAQSNDRPAEEREACEMSETAAERG